MKFVIIGLGQFGKSLALHLTNNGYEVTVLDRNQAAIDEIKNDVVDARVGDATDVRVLKKLDMTGDDTHVIIAVGENYMERSIFLTAQLKELGVKHLYVRSINELQAKVLRLLGVENLIQVEEAAARQLTEIFINDGLMRLRKIDANHSLAEVNLPKEWEGKTLIGVNMRKLYKINLLTIRRGDRTEITGAEGVLSQPESPVIDSPDPSIEFKRGDVLVIFGKNDDLQDFVKKFNL